MSNQQSIDEERRTYFYWVDMMLTYFISWLKDSSDLLNLGCAHEDDRQWGWQCEEGTENKY